MAPEYFISIGVIYQKQQVCTVYITKFSPRHAIKVDKIHNYVL